MNATLTEQRSDKFSSQRRQRISTGAPPTFSPVPIDGAPTSDGLFSDIDPPALHASMRPGGTITREPLRHAATRVRQPAECLAFCARLGADLKITALQGETLDAMCWRYYRSTAGTVEAVLDANPDLTAYGVVLPMGVCVEMPGITTIENTQPLLQLFD